MDAAHIGAELPSLRGALHPEADFLTAVMTKARDAPETRYFKPVSHSAIAAPMASGESSWT